MITTIHAPRSDIFHLFDQLMLLTQGPAPWQAGLALAHRPSVRSTDACMPACPSARPPGHIGHIAYYGSAEGMPAYFAGIGHPCPAYSNPCDFYVDLTTVSFRSVDAEAQTRATVNAIVAAYSRQLVVDDTKAEAAVPPATAPEPAKTSGWRQFTLLLLRSFRHQLKDRVGLILDFVQTLTISLVIGVVFWVRMRGARRPRPLRTHARSPAASLLNTRAHALGPGAHSQMLGRDQVSVSDRFGCIYNIATLYMFMVILTTIARCTAREDVWTGPSRLLRRRRMRRPARPIGGW